MEPAKHPFTVKVAAALTGETLCEFTSPNVDALLVRDLKLAIQKRLGLLTPFTIRLLKGAEPTDDFCHMREIIDTNEIQLDYLLQRRTRPDTCQQVALAEAIGYQLPRTVWRILSNGLLLTECLPMSGSMTINPLTLHLQSRSLTQSPYTSTSDPCILESLLQANCDPNYFGHPPKPPILEAARRNDLPTIRVLVAWRANVNLQARGNELPLVFAAKNRRPEMVKCLLDLRANPTACCYSPISTHPRARWVQHTVKELTEPGSEIAQIIERAVQDWEPTNC